MPPQVFLFQLKNAAPWHFSQHLPSYKSVAPVAEAHQDFMRFIKKRRVKRKTTGKAKKAARLLVWRTRTSMKSG